MLDRERAYRAIYDEAERYYEELRPRLGPAALGFKILYGPPILEPRIAFLGFQPGGDVLDAEREIRTGAHRGWPESNEYLTEPWLLARALRSMVPASLLAETVGLNAIIFRARSEAEFRSRIPSDMRREMTQFSLELSQRLLRALRPKLIVAIGFSTASLVGVSAPTLYGSKGRILARRGYLGSVPVIATLHLSGARISTTDRLALSDLLTREAMSHNRETRPS